MLYVKKTTYDDGHIDLMVQENNVMQANQEVIGTIYTAMDEDEFIQNVAADKLDSVWSEGIATIDDAMNAAYELGDKLKDILHPTNECI